MNLKKAFSRRASLATLGAAGLTATLANPHFTDARKKQRKKQGKQLKADALCKKQVGQCSDFFTPSCVGNPDCLATVDRCCPELGSCALDGFFDCVNASGDMAKVASLELP